MWPFSQRPKFHLPAWTFQSIEDEHTILSLSLGKWVATDGAYFTSDSVELGHVLTQDGFVDLVRSADGPESLTFAYRIETRAAQPTKKLLTIDSGDIVLCSQDAFNRGGITMADHRTSYMLHRAAQIACPGKKAVLIRDSDQHCIGIVVAPMWGDGSYRLEFRSRGEFQTLQIRLAESC